MSDLLHPVPVGPLRYQSPVDLRKRDVTFHVSQLLKSKGHNDGAKFDKEHKIYVVQQRIELRVGTRKYLLVEFHFHVLGGSEHYVEGKQFDAELHYVFVPAECPRRPVGCICDGPRDDDSNPDDTFLVVARFLRLTKSKNGDSNCRCRCPPELHDREALKHLQVDLPCKYWELDGSLTGAVGEHPRNNYLPVRWLVGDGELDIPRAAFSEANSKPTRALQPKDDRLLLRVK
jgi:carbonic anhydrase